MPPATADSKIDPKSPKTRRVLMTECVAGRQFVHRPGQEYDLPAQMAERYVAAGIATHVTDEDTIALHKSRLEAMGYKITAPPAA
jgi:hypothetical protein